MRTSCEDLLDVLVVQARPRPAPDLAAVLEEGGVAALGVAGADGAMIALRERRPAAVLIDVDVLAQEGTGLVSRLQDASGSAIVIALGPDRRPARVEALAAGCDLYLPRPASGDELLATVRAALRLLRRLGGRRRGEVYDDGLVRIDAALRQVEVGGAPIPLTPLEFRLLMALVRGRDRVVSREELLESTWHGAATADCDHVKLYVHYLRRKLAEHTRVELIQTVRGFGYRWVGAGPLGRAEPPRRFRQREGAAR